MDKNSFIQIIIKSQQNLYRHKAELFNLGIEWNNKDKQFYNKHEISYEALEEAKWTCQKNDFTFEIKDKETNSKEETIYSKYEIKNVEKTAYVIKSRMSNQVAYFINIMQTVDKNIITVINTTDGTVLAINKYMDTKRQVLLSLHVLINEYKDLNKEKNEKFNIEVFMEIFTTLLGEHDEEKSLFDKINKFKHMTISAIEKERGAYSFLCNCVKGFSPEAHFYLKNKKIESTLTGNYILPVQEKRIWTYLFNNRERIGKEHKPTIYELFVGSRILVIINGFETKAPISKATWNNGNMIIEVNTGEGSYRLPGTHTKEQLWKRLLEAR